MMYKTIILGLLLLGGLQASGQLLNGNFELWSATLEQSTYEEELKALGVNNPQQAIPDGWQTEGLPYGICRVDNYCADAHALLLFSWYNGEKALLQQHFSISSRPMALSGCYQYIFKDTAYSQAEKFAELILWHEGDTIGTAHFDFDTTAAYTDFEIPIVYSSGAIPDSMSILFYTDVIGSSSFPADGLLYLDDLQLVETKTPSSTPAQESDFDIYPNPFVHHLFIDCKKQGTFYFEVIDLKGQLFDRGLLSKKTNRLDIDHLPGGLYLLSVIDEKDRILVQKFIKI